MAAAPPPLPSRFPCWCRAVYSWGGESKHDLGFIEGDLIECLNAGDGSWWVGRLFRDRRTVGSFPSNFVEVLPDDFRPTTRSASPAAAAHAATVAPPQKSKTFRKPFEAYAKAPHYTTAKQPETYREHAKTPQPTPAAQPSPAPVPSNDSVYRQPSDAAYQRHTPSPSPYARTQQHPSQHYSSHGNSLDRGRSPQPPTNSYYRPPSANPQRPPSARPPSARPPSANPYAAHTPHHSESSIAQSTSPYPQHYQHQASHSGQSYNSHSSNFYHNNYNHDNNHNNNYPGNYSQPYRRDASPQPSMYGSYTRTQSPMPSPSPQPYPGSSSYHDSARGVGHTYPYHGHQNSGHPSPSPNPYRPPTAASPQPYGNEMVLAQQQQHQQSYQRGGSPMPFSHSPVPFESSPHRSEWSSPQHQQYQQQQQQAYGPPRGRTPQPEYVSYQPPRGRTPQPEYAMDGRGRSPQPEYRAYSPYPMAQGGGSRDPSPRPDPYAYSRGPPSPIPPSSSGLDGIQRGNLSPAPSFVRNPDLYLSKSAPARDASPSPPPPPPPPHRHGVQSNMSQSTIPMHPSPSQNASPNTGMGQGPTTPAAPGSPGIVRLTPSPLREAMDSVIDQLAQLDPTHPNDGRNGAAMQVNTQNVPRSNSSSTDQDDIWSPEQFGLGSSPKKTNGRPGTSATTPDEGYETWSGGSSKEPSYQNGTSPREERASPLPQLSDYVERMEKRLQEMHEQNKIHVDEVIPRPPTASGPTGTTTTGNPNHGSGSGRASPLKKGSIPTTMSTTTNATIRPGSAMGLSRIAAQELVDMAGRSPSPERKLRLRKSTYDVGVRGGSQTSSTMERTYTTKTNSTSASSGDRSLMSGASASGISATSAASLERRNNLRTRSAFGFRDDEDIPENRSGTPFTGVTYHSSHASDSPEQKKRLQENERARSLSPTKTARPATSHITFHNGTEEDEEGAGTGTGGLVAPKPPKRSIFKKLLDSAKTGVASGRNSIAIGSETRGSNRNSQILGLHFGGSKARLQQQQQQQQQQQLLQQQQQKHMSSVQNAGPSHLMGIEAARDMGLASSPPAANSSGAAGLPSATAIDWVQVRRDVNRCNTLSRHERNDRRERALMMDYPAVNAVDELYENLQGCEGANGLPLTETLNYSAINFGQVDKNVRFLSNLPTTLTPVGLATTYVCRPYRSDVQRLRAIFTWVAERILWEEDFEGPIDPRRTIQTKRACAEEYAVLVMEMCAAVGIQCEVIHGYLKRPGEIPEMGIVPRSNHWWNAVMVDGEWRVMDCCLASPSHPLRPQYSAMGCSSTSLADPWWFLTSPLEACWTHLPEHGSQQHLCPPIAPEVLLSLPCVSPTYFTLGLEMHDFNSSLCRLEDLEVLQVQVNVAEDVELVAEVETRDYTRDKDGDVFETGEVVKKRALAQAEWYQGTKRYTVKALLPSDEGHGTLKLYAGKRGMMHSIKEIPHPLAISLPILHTGENSPFDFVRRHPTPHAQRHDIYVAQPQCHRLALNNTFVFSVRQHPSSLTSPVSPVVDDHAQPSPFMRPSSALSLTAASSTSGNSSQPSSSASAGGYPGGKKPAKLAIQTPGGKILRLMRKEDAAGGGGGSSSPTKRAEEKSDGGTWETIIKCSERGTWRGLVLADRTARWCVFAEWECV